MTTAIVKKAAIKPVENAVLATPAKAPIVKKASDVKPTAAKLAAMPAIKPAIKPTIKQTIKQTSKAATKPAAKQASKPFVTAVESAKANAKKPVAVVEKLKKAKLIRDSFTIPEDEYAVLSRHQKSLLASGIEAKKSQLLRVGLVLLKKATEAELKKQLADLSPLKAGRPKKEK